jgi:hypothetical protein
VDQLFTVSNDAERPDDGRHDFDFLIGRWMVAHRRLRRRLAGDDAWDEFAGACEMRPLIGGLGNVDDNVLELPEGSYRAAAVRLFDPGERRWSIWWIDGRVLGLEPPVHGRFENGIGTFVGEDAFEGRPILVRFVWSEIRPASARWQQAFSPDGGATWETNWDMRFTRLG